MPKQLTNCLLMMRHWSSTHFRSHYHQWVAMTMETMTDMTTVTTTIMMVITMATMTTMTEIMMTMMEIMATAATMTTTETTTLTTDQCLPVQMATKSHFWSLTTVKVTVMALMNLNMIAKAMKSVLSHVWMAVRLCFLK